MFSMNTGQLDSVKLSAIPPSKKVGNGLSVATTPAVTVTVERIGVETAGVVDGACVSGISTVVVTDPEASWDLLLNSCSAGCNLNHFSPSQNAIRSSSISSSNVSGVGVGCGIDVGRGSPSMAARRIAARPVGSGSSLTGEARAMEANDRAMQSTRPAHCGCDVLR